jgi:hypothetical protein
MKTILLFVCYLLAVIQVDVSVAESGNRYRTPKPLGSFGEGVPVYGVYTQKDTIYAIRDSTPYIETFSATRGNKQQMNLTLSGLQGPYDMVGIAQLQTLYILDWFNWNNVTTFSLKSGNSQSQFSLQETQYSSFALSLTKYDTIIATCSASQKIRDFSPTGRVLREIYVNVTQPRHTIKLRNGRGYAMCHGYGTDQLHRVCLLSDTGDVLKCYGSTNGSGIGHLDVPARVFEDEYSNIWVADLNNKRIVVLSPSLEYITTLLSAKEGLQGPYRMLVDGSLLYVSDNTVEGGLAVSGRVLVFQLQQ